MNNRDFDNLFNNKLNGINEGDFDFNDAAWQSVEGTLEKEKILVPKWQWRKFLPLLLILGFLVSNGLLSWKYFSASIEVSSLETKVSTLENQLSLSQNELIGAKETVRASILEDEKKEDLAREPISISNPKIKIVEKIVEKIIYVPQIVYVNQGDGHSPNLSLSNGSFSDNSRLVLKNSIFNQPNLGSLPSNYGDTSAANFYLSDKWVKSLDFIMIEGADSLDVSDADKLVFDNNFDNTFSKNFDNSLGLDSLDFFKKITEAAAEKTKADNLFLEIKAIQPLEYDLDSLAELENQTKAKRNKNSLGDYLFVIGQTVSPDGYELGITGNGTFGYSKNYFNNPRAGAGIVGGFRFSDNIRLSVGAILINSIYELDDIANGQFKDSLFKDLPPLNPFSPDDQLSKVEGNMQFFEFPLEVEYIFLKNKKWRPFIGAGVVARYHFAQSFEYYFLQSPNYVAEYNTGYKDGKFRAFGLDTWTAKAGVEYSINRHWLARTSFNYANDFNENGIDKRTFQQFGGRLSLMYCF